MCANLGAMTVHEERGAGSVRADPADARAPGRAAGRGERLLERVLAGSGGSGEPLRHVVHQPARAGRTVPWPSWAPPAVRAALGERGITQPWSHQAQAAELAHAGRDVVVATGTASGKSLAYQLPVLAAFDTDPRATALYLSPTKALAADQLRAVTGLGLPDVRATPFDGDTPLAERDWARQHGRWLFSNPDMLHRSVLPHHARWAAYLRRQLYVVLDE
ncbi:MAG: box helicase protein [Pseudonocardiales bacterium]|nr:box helicase protein [Pseudonocardiales bacterium]